MTTLPDIEEAYYRAIQASKISDAEGCGTSYLSACYLRQEFEKWVRKVDIYELDKEKANFTLDEHIVKVFSDWCLQVEKDLCFVSGGIKFKGRLKNIGSCHDGSKVGKMNEVDSVYVLEENNFHIEPTDTPRCYRIFIYRNSEKLEILPNNIRKEFAEAYSRVVSQLDVPQPLKHGGFLAPCYSGLRYNGPAATSQFFTSDSSLRTWDITPTFCFPRTHGVYGEVRKLVQPILAMNADKLFGETDIHLIPDPGENLWRLSTAQLETEILRELLSSIAPLKQALSYCKVLSSKLKKWNSKHLRCGSFQSADLGLAILRELEECREAKSENQWNAKSERLSKKLRYAHIWIPPEKRTVYNEDEKGYVSINTAAIKHILLAAALKHPEVLSPKQNMELVINLMQHVFQELGSSCHYSSPHAFLIGLSIPHLSILASQGDHKMELAMAVKGQCRMLRAMAMSKAEYPSFEIMEIFADETNALVVPLAHVTCAEYCFSCCMNPLQHPSFDPKIQHFVALATSLCNSCGGVIFLTAPEGITQQEINFKKFKTQLFQVLTSVHICEDLEIFEPHAGEKLWGMIVVKHSQKPLPYNFDITETVPCLDVRGRLQYKHVTARRSDTFEFLEGASSLQTSPSSEAEPDVPGLPSNYKVLQPTGLPAEFPILSELNWDKNKSNWQGILKESRTSIDNCVDACAIWEPKLPMQITPDRQSLRCLFPSDDVFNQTLAKVETEVPGFAIANRSWLSLLPELDVTSLPPGHLCDILTVSADSDVCLWVIVSESGEQIVQQQIQYMFAVGRAIKHQIVKHNRLAPNLTIRCMLHSTNSLHTHLIEIALDSSGIKSIQAMLCSLLLEKGKFEELQRAIALLLMSRESSIRNCVGHAMTVKLSAAQTQTLLRRKRVTYVSSAPGTGKTLCGISLYREYGRERAVYICTTQALLHYLGHNGCHGILVQGDDDMLEHIKHGAFENKQCVIIDESHHLKCSKLCFEKLFCILDTQRMYLFVLADNAYQSLDSENQRQIVNSIFELSMKVLKEHPELLTFNDMFRNTRKVTSFVQHAMVDTKLPVEHLTCANRFDGNGVGCITMENLLLDNPNNSLVKYLRPLLIQINHLQDAMYQATDVAVLFDEEYPVNYIEKIRYILQTHISPGITTQTSEDFPRYGIVVDRINTFIGLDAALCIFLLSSMGRTPYLTLDNPRYRVFLASRATHQAVFVVPKIDAHIAQCMKFDYFGLPVDYSKLGETGRYRIQWGQMLWGLCYYNQRLFTVEMRIGLGWRLCMYQDAGQELTLLDTVTVKEGVEGVWHPRVDGHNQRVYIPGGQFRGVSVFSWKENRLKTQRILTCVGMCLGLGVISRHTLCACDEDRGSVSVVNVTNDTVTASLQTPEEVTVKVPRQTAVLGDTILVWYGYENLVIYENGQSSPGTMVTWPAGLESLHGICLSSDCVSRFLVWEHKSNVVFTLDVKGKLCDKLDINNDNKQVWDCTLGGGKLWVGCHNGDIIVMSPQ